MMPVEPPVFEGSHLVTLAKDQPQYKPLLAAVDAEGIFLTEWEPTEEELHLLFCGGRIRLWTHTFNEPFQPVRLEVVEPECGMRES